MWYVIQVMTGKEDDIAGKLKEQGIRALVPKENRLIRSGGSWSQREYIPSEGAAVGNQYHKRNTRCCLLVI